MTYQQIGANNTITLPCNIGDKVWTISHRNIHEFTVSGFIIDHKGLSEIILKSTYSRITIRVSILDVFFDKDKADEYFEKEKEKWTK